MLRLLFRNKIAAGQKICRFFIYVAQALLSCLLKLLVDRSRPRLRKGTLHFMACACSVALRFLPNAEPAHPFPPCNPR
jgi:hypothetical protein